VGDLTRVDAVFTDAQLDNHRHGTGPFADRASQRVMLAQVKRYGLEILAQRQGLADNPRLVGVTLIDAGEDLSPVQTNTDR
jgi:hypothetical protein